MIDSTVFLLFSGAADDGGSGRGVAGHRAGRSGRRGGGGAHVHGDERGPEDQQHDRDLLHEGKVLGRPKSQTGVSWISQKLKNNDPRNVVVYSQDLATITAFTLNRNKTDVVKKQISFLNLFFI